MAMFPDGLIVKVGREVSFGELAEPPEKPTKIGYWRWDDTLGEEVEHRGVDYVVHPDGAAEEVELLRGRDDDYEVVARKRFQAGTWDVEWPRSHPIGSWGGREIVPRS